MLRTLTILGLTLTYSVFAQPAPPAPTLTLTLQNALDRARANSQQLLSADIAARIAHEDRVQAKAALLPTATWENGYVYTQPNGSDTGVFVANNGQNVYTNLGNIHGDVYAPGKRADYRMAIAAEAIARARVEIAARGLTAVVVQNFYAMAVAQRALLANAQRACRRPSSSWTSPQKQEAGGRGGALRRGQGAAHSSTSACATCRRRNWLSTRPASVSPSSSSPISARISPWWTIWTSLTRWPRFPKSRRMARNNNPDIRAAQAAVTQQTYRHQERARRAACRLFRWTTLRPEANQYALHNEFGQNNLGSSVVASLNVPCGTGAPRAAGQAGRTAAAAGAESTSASRSASCSRT